MGADIHVHVEYYSSRKKSWIHSNVEFDTPRLYAMFSIMAYELSDIIRPLYRAKGLPGDITRQTYIEHRDYGGDAHTESWLTTDEFRECLDEVDSIIRSNYPEHYDPEWLKEYELIYKYMKDSNDEGEPARIVFWFDN